MALMRVRGPATGLATGLATYLATFTPIRCIWMPFVAALAFWARRLETGLGRPAMHER